MQAIPLVNRKGEILAHAVVDDSDAPSLLKHVWQLRVSRSGNRYAAHTESNLYTLMHREILGLTGGDGLEVDHINRDGLDNRRRNLRVITHGQNQQNRPGQKGTSKFRGVWSQRKRGRLTGRWAAGYQLNGRSIHVGIFQDEREAAFAVAKERSKYLPFSYEELLN